MTNKIAKILFAKEQYSGKIGDWEWLTQKQLLFVLDKTSDYDSFHQALTHNHLEKKERDHWFSTRAAEQTQRSKRAAYSKDHKEKILAAFDVLKVQAYRHTITSLTDPNYTDVARAAFELYHTLPREVEACFSADNHDKQACQENCKKAIELG
ncbi:MAG: hypothetical protein ACRCXC_04810 [Legionella sp.]